MLHRAICWRVDCRIGAILKTFLFGIGIGNGKIFTKKDLSERNLSFYNREKPTSTFPSPSVLWCKFLLSSPFCKRNMDTFFIIGFVEQWSVHYPVTVGVVGSSPIEVASLFLNGINNSITKNPSLINLAVKRLWKRNVFRPTITIKELV